jgi:phosphohistidine phosphatase
MKTLLLMRHAKSSWKDAELSDFDRPLNKRGKNDAPLMGKFLRKKDLTPDIILSSAAKRASKTAEAVAEGLKYKEEIIFLENFYLAEPFTYIEEINQVDNDHDIVLVIGHNPGLEGLVQILSGKVLALSTSAVAEIELPIKKWKDLTLDTDGKLENLWRPKDVK